MDTDPNHHVNPFDALVGKQMSSVEFVLNDYLDLHFDGPDILVLSTIIVEMKGERRRFHEPGFCDLICQVAGKKVTRTRLEWGDSVTLSFGDDTRITISLVPEDGLPESVNFILEGEFWIY